MNHLARKLVEGIRSRVSQAATAGEEVRLIFHGPPLELLEPVFQELAGELNDSVPVVLQVPRLQASERNPMIGASGKCDEHHLLNIRNSPSRPAYLALVPPGQHSIRSVSSTSDEFGIGPGVNAGNAPFEEWWADEFIQEIVSAGIESAGIPQQQREGARLLVERAAEAADEVDPDRIQRKLAWRVISRLFSCASLNPALAPAKALSLACGVPPTQAGTIDARAQTAALAKIVDALAEGFATGIKRIQAEANEDDVASLGDFLTHLQSTCDKPTAFERATAAFYPPGSLLAIQIPPRWWTQLTVEKWDELLVEEADAVGDILMSCTNGLIALGKGMPVVVESEVELSFVASGPEAADVDVTVERTPASNGQKLVGAVRVGESLTDNRPPLHKTPMRYVASADGYKPGAIKVVSLATWAPGVLVVCRLARKLATPKKASKRARGDVADWETTLTVPGVGRYELLVFHSPGVELEDEAVGTLVDGKAVTDEELKLAVRSVRPGQAQIEVEADTNLQIDLFFRRGASKADVEACRVHLVCEAFEEQGCRSEFERLIRANRRIIDPAEAKSVVQIDRAARSTSLQDWMLSADTIASSFIPVVLAEDYVDGWVRPTWEGEAGPILSRGRFIQDPRPAPGEFDAPEAFIKARRQVAARIRGDGDESGLCESAELGKWFRNDESFRAVVEEYLDAYTSWLAASPDVACWVDLVVVATLENNGRTLGRVPEAVFVSPLHPVRIAWHCLAQNVLLDADEQGKPCPAASVLDPDCIPDILTLSLRSPSGIEKVSFLAVENGTDYWSVLWNGDRLGTLPQRSQHAPFGQGFGIAIGGISTGFSTGQVKRALEDVSDLLGAKPVVGVAITSAVGTTDACNDGLIGWCSDQYRENASARPRLLAGPRLVDIFDHRPAALRPDDATIANLSEDTKNRVRWFDRQPEHSVPDLGIIAQLDTSEPSASPVSNRSPLGYGGLLRHRIRRQLPAAFLSESRQSASSGSSDDAFADKVARCTVAMENLGQERVGLRFAPNVDAIRELLEVRKTDFVAVSSSAVDPACFLGGWLAGAYLWDYDLPSYSHRAGDTNGYYLLTRVKDADRVSLAKTLSRLPGCSDIGEPQVQGALLEIARRGIPTIRGLAGEDTGATGDLGLFVAARLLQDRFRAGANGESLLQVTGGSEDDVSLAIVVPIDPFRGYLFDLTRSLRHDRKETTFNRPDLLVIGARIDSQGVRLRLTPVEVKCRPDSTYPAGDVQEALEQARSLSKLLASMTSAEGQPQLWKLAFQHLLLSFVGFGMRVYSQHSDVVVNEQRWSSFHEDIAAAILGAKLDVTIDERGRLIVIDESPRSSPKDFDGDGFEESIVIGKEDAGRIAAGDPAGFYELVRSRVGDWQLLPGDRSEATRAKPPSRPDVPLPTPHAPTPAPVMVPATPNGPRPLAAASDESLPPVAAPSPGVVLDVGSTVDGFEPQPLSLNISDTRLNQLNIGVVGDLGTGKTQLLKALVKQISSSTLANRGIRPRFLIFDYKRDYSSADFVEATGAKVVRPHRLPLNLFDTTSLGDSVTPWLDRFRFFSDVLDKIYTGIGPVQRDKLKRAVRSAYEGGFSGQQPTLYDVHAAYSALLDGKSDSPMAIIDDLVDMEVFASKPSEIQSFDSFLDGVVVISLDALGQDDRSKNMLVAVMLNMFYENMLRTPKRPFLGNDPQLRAIDSYLLVDEADNIMRYEFDVLRKLLLQGREFGTGIILASQYLRHFKVNATDYREPLLTWFVHKVPNVTAAELSALGLTGDSAELAEQVKSLKNHQCLYKSFDIPGTIIRGRPFFELASGRKGD